VQTWNFQTGHGWFWWAPDHPDKGNEQRIMASLSYRPAPTEHFAQEYDLRYQRRLDDWNIRFLPNNAYAGYYPSGVWEDLNSYAHDVFARAQLTAKAPSFPTITKETSLTWFPGDRRHKGPLSDAACVPGSAYLALWAFRAQNALWGELSAIYVT
jgi:hypothetical protein